MSTSDIANLKNLESKIIKQNNKLAKYSYAWQDSDSATVTVNPWYSTLTMIRHSGSPPGWCSGGCNRRLAGRRWRRPGASRTAVTRIGHGTPGTPGPSRHGFRLPGRANFAVPPGSGRHWPGRGQGCPGCSRFGVISGPDIRNSSVPGTVPGIPALDCCSCLADLDAEMATRDRFMIIIIVMS